MNISPLGNLGNGYQNQDIDQSSSEIDERELVTDAVAQQRIRRSKGVILKSPLDDLMKGNDEASMNFFYSFDRDMSPENLMLEFQRLIKKNDGSNRIRLFDQLLIWVRLRPSDFTKKGMVSSALSLIDELIDLKRANSLKLGLLKRLDPSLFPLSSPEKPMRISEEFQSASLSQAFILGDVGLISNQLTDETSHIYLCMMPIDLTKPKLAEFAPILSKRFNQLTFWLVSMILLAESKKEQLFLVNKMISVAKHLYNRGNFQDAAAVTAALDNHDITRLPYLWNEINDKETKTVNLLNQFFSPLENYKNYRGELISREKELILPLLPVHLRDIITTSEIDQNDLSIIGRMLSSYLKHQCKWWSQRGSVKPLCREATISFLSEEDRHSLSDRWRKSNGSHKKVRESAPIPKRKQMSVPRLKRKQGLASRHTLKNERNSSRGISDQTDDFDFVRPVKSETMPVIRSAQQKQVPFTFEVACEQTSKAKKYEIITQCNDVHGFNLAAIATCVKRSHENNCSCELVSQNLEGVIGTRLRKYNPISALKLSFGDLEELIIKGKLGKTGCGLSVVLFKQKKSQLHIYTANVGDSPITYSHGKNFQILSETHRCTNVNESKRILDLGGPIIRDKVSGILDVTRCLGIMNGKKYLSNIPHLNEVKVNISKDIRLSMSSYNEGSMITVDCKEIKDD